MPEDQGRQPPPPPKSFSELLRWLGLSPPPKPVYGPPLRQPAPVVLEPWQQGGQSLLDFAYGASGFGVDPMAPPDPNESPALNLGALVSAAVPLVPGLKAAKRLATAATAAKAAEAPAVAAGWLEEIAALFPRLDKYSKPAGRVTAKTIVSRAEAASAQLSPEAKAALQRVAEQVGDQRVAPDAVHALAQGREYTPERVLRKVKPLAEGVKSRPGAPLGVTTARHERAARERYMQRMLEGVTGRNWYEDAGLAIREYANDDPARAMLVAEDVAITSPATTVSANTGFGVKAYNQATAGVPVEAGRFPTAMGKAVTEAHAVAEGEGATGLKRLPFSQNIARGGGFLGKDVPPRPVNDIWQGEAFGFVNPDGSPLRTGFTPAQHRWMDEQTRKIIKEANERGLGGHTDWTVERAQAAAWVAAKVRSGEVKLADAARSYKHYLGDLAAQGSREVTPGRTTGHLPELLAPGAGAERRLLSDLVTRESGIYDPLGRDQIAAGYGGLVGRSFEGPGVWEGQVTPGRQTQVLTGSLEVPGGPTGARMLDEGSRRILEASEATHGLLTAQDAVAYSRILPSGSGVARNAWDVTLPGGTVTDAQMQALLQRLGPGAADSVLVPTPDGIRLAYMDEPTAKGIVKTLSGKVKQAGTLQGTVLSNDWQVQRLGQGYWEAIRRLGTEKFDRFAPGIAEKLRTLDAQFAKETGGRFTLSPAMDEIRAAIAGEGFAGLEKLAKKYGVSVTALAAALTALQAAPRGDTARASQ